MEKSIDLFYILRDFGLLNKSDMEHIRHAGKRLYKLIDKYDKTNMENE